MNKILSKNTFIDENNYTLYYPINSSDIYLYKYVGTYVYKYNFISSFNTDSTINYKCAGYFNTTSAINALRFKMDSGNMDGTIYLYGIK